MMSNEKSIIEFEAARNKAMDLWFDARKHIELNITSQFIFEAGFRMAWELNQSKITTLEQQLAQERAINKIQNSEIGVLRFELAQEREAKSKLSMAIQNIRDSDCGAWMKDCQYPFSCSEGRQKRLEMMKILDKAYLLINPPSEVV